MNFNFPGVKFLTVLITLLIVIVPAKIDSDPTVQSRAEKLVSTFLAQHGSYMALDFGNVDTAYTTLEDEPFFKELNQRVVTYQDLTIQFSHTNVMKADSLYSIYKKLNLQKDSLRIHYKPRPMGYFILHHFLFDGKPLTDSFVIDFNLRTLLKAKETVE